MELTKEPVLPKAPRDFRVLDFKEILIVGDYFWDLKEERWKPVTNIGKQFGECLQEHIMVIRHVLTKEP